MINRWILHIFLARNEATVQFPVQGARRRFVQRLRPRGEQRRPNGHRLVPRQVARRTGPVRVLHGRRRRLPSASQLLRRGQVPGASAGASTCAAARRRTPSKLFGKWGRFPETQCFPVYRIIIRKRITQSTVISYVSESLSLQ